MQPVHSKAATIGLAAAMFLSACGGGGSGPAPAPLPPPPSPPPPPPPPPPTSSFDDAEYRASDYAVAANALAAYNRGATGRGAKIAIIDSGIDSRSAEFAGRIDPASTGMSDEGGHGTGVAQIAAGARNGVGTLGVAFDSTILSLDTLTCIVGDCFHRLNDLAAAVDYSVTNNADVINLSVVGPATNGTLSAAIDRATRAGVVVVIAAGNSGAANPDGFALQNAQAAANSALIIAGAYQGQTLISSRAGDGQEWFLASSGGSTSASTPVISGAAALLAAAFPNLSGAQIVSILFSSADDAGSPGIDEVYGRGILNIGRAFQPSGATSFAGTGLKLGSSATGSGSAPMGDFASRPGPRAIILDAYSRAYWVDLGKTVGGAAEEVPLHQAAHGGSARSMSFVGEAFDLSFSFAREGIRDLRSLDHWSHFDRLAPGERRFRTAAIAAIRPWQRTEVAFAKGYDGRAIRNRLSGEGEPGFVAARDSSAWAGLRRGVPASIGVRQILGKAAVTATLETGRTDASIGGASYSIAALTAERRLGPARLRIGASGLREQGTVLGANFGEAIGTAGSATTFVDVETDFSLGFGWSVAGAYRRGWTSVGGSSGLLKGGSLSSDAFSFDLVKTGLAAAGDRIGIRFAQQLRVRSGGLSLHLPTAFDYASNQASFERRPMSLAPVGRELDFEASYGRLLFGGVLSINGYVRREPGNIRSGRDDFGGLIRFARFD